jgi:hypothetical protein
MAVDVWEPSKPAAINREKLEQYLQVIKTISLDQIADEFPPMMQKSDAGLMKLQEEQWQVASELDDEALALLIRFFTLAEKQLPNWDGGQTSPVIYFVRILKERGSFGAELKRWIKSNTDNRYLPNGAVIF